MGKENANMKIIRVAIVACALTVLGGCVAVPVGPAYAEGPGYYAPPVYVGPSIGIGIIGGRHSHGHFRSRGFRHRY